MYDAPAIMLTIDYFPQLTHALDVRGTVTAYDPDTGAALGRYVIQGATAENATFTLANGQHVMLREYQIPTDPATGLQRTQRATLAAAVAAFQADPASARELAHATALTRGLTDYQAFIGLYMRAHPTTPGTHWDSGATAWDSGETLWDAT